MPQNESQYRGYIIGMERKGSIWLINVSPTRPDLPILHRCLFERIAQSEVDAMAEAKGRVDRVLAS
jgi:hypothetical protein